MSDSQYFFWYPERRVHVWNDTRNVIQRILQTCSTYRTQLKPSLLSENCFEALNKMINNAVPQLGRDGSFKLYLVHLIFCFLQFSMQRTVFLLVAHFKSLYILLLLLSHCIVSQWEQKCS